MTEIYESSSGDNINIEQQFRGVEFAIVGGSLNITVESGRDVYADIYLEDSVTVMTALRDWLTKQIERAG